MFSSIDSSLKSRFGSKHGLLRSVRHRFYMALGHYECYKNIDFSKLNRLIFICSGNICRSALAKSVCDRVGVSSDSYGLHCRGGDGADPRAIAYAEAAGLCLSEHITKNIADYEPKKGDLLVGMEPKHIEALETLYGEEVPMTLIGLWLENPMPYIHDPFNTNPTFFNKCEQWVAEATYALAMRIER